MQILGAWCACVDLGFSHCSILGIREVKAIDICMSHTAQVHFLCLRLTVACGPSHNETLVPVLESVSNHTGWEH